ncbi:MAG TPA: MFS transporter [Thermomicrobiales bacterium]|nr:MFS transporter [Thermomicrobiales bacterium]
MSYVRSVKSYSQDIRLYLIYTLVANVSIGVFALVFNLYLLQLGLRENFIGAFNAIHTIAIAGTALSMGWMLNRYGVWKCVTFGTSAFIVASAALTVVTSPAVLLTLAVVYGMATSFVFTPVMPFIVELTRSRQRADVSALVFSLTSVSTVIGSLVGGWMPRLLSVTFGLELPGAMAFRLTLIAGLVIAAFGIIPLLRMSSQRKRNKPADSAADATQAGLPELPTGHVRRRMAVFIVVGGLMSLGAGAVFPFYNVFLAEIGASAGQIGLIFAAGWTLAAVVGLTSPLIARRLGSQKAVTIVRLLPVPFFIALIVQPALGLAVFVHWLRISSVSLGWPIDSTYISEVLPARARTAIFGYRSAAWNVGFSISSLVAGAAIVRYGYGPSFGAYAFFMTAAMVVFYLYFARIAAPAFIPDDMPAAPTTTNPGETADDPQRWRRRRRLPADD